MSALNPCPRSIQVGEFEVAKGGGVWVAVRESISDDIKKCSNFVPRSVSKGAQERAISLPGAGPEVDLAAQSWHEQHAIDPDREIFHFEHMTPVSAVREACLIAVSA